MAQLETRLYVVSVGFWTERGALGGLPSGEALKCLELRFGLVCYFTGKIGARSPGSLGRLCCATTVGLGLQSVMQASERLLKLGFRVDGLLV